MTALVASVVPCTNTVMSPTPLPASPSMRRTPSSTASSGRWGVVSSLRVSRRPPSSNTTSVKVPPISTAMRKSLATLIKYLLPRRGRDRRPGLLSLQLARQAAYGRPVTAASKKLRSQVFSALRPSEPSPAARRWRTFHLIVLAVGLLAVILLSIDEFASGHRAYLRGAIWIVTTIFLVEYLVRLWVAPEVPTYVDKSPTRARLHWIVSLPGLIGLLATMPAVMLTGGYSITGADTASVFCILWIMKLGLHAPAFGTLARVISNERAPIASVSDRLRHLVDGRGHRCPHVRAGETA
jgi:hypothetical protein